MVHFTGFSLDLQTSVTIDGIKYVVDSGFVKVYPTTRFPLPTLNKHSSGRITPPHSSHPYQQSKPPPLLPHSVLEGPEGPPLDSAIGSIPPPSSNLSQSTHLRS